MPINYVYIMIKRVCAQHSIARSRQYQILFLLVLHEMKQARKQASRQASKWNEMIIILF